MTLDVRTLQRDEKYRVLYSTATENLELVGFLNDIILTNEREVVLEFMTTTSHYVQTDHVLGMWITTADTHGPRAPRVETRVF